MEKCILCNSEFTFMNAKIGKTKENEGFCRECYKKLCKINSGLKYSNYSKQELNQILNGEIIESLNVDNINNTEQPIIFSLVMKIISGLASLWLIYTAVKFLLFN